MKTLKLLKKPLLLLALAGVTLGSCSKGEQGETGPGGAQGEKGVTGDDGKTVLNGTTAPSNSVGKTGDFYINTNSSTFYGPKTSSGWGAGTSIIGATGSKGTAGSKILSGTGTPSASVGATGDYYLDKNSSSFYGPKASTGWGTALSLKGKTGTANVLYSGWNYAKNFRDTTADNSALKAADLLAPALTTENLNSGLVQVYFTFGGGVYALPYTNYAGGKLNNIAYLPRLKHFIITRFTADNTNSVPLSTALEYRYVIIPGGVAAPTAAKRPDINDYKAVKKYYNIPD